jgi:hypothetical protein
MKKLLFTISLIIYSVFAFGQTDTTQIEEYAIVRVRVYFAGGEICKPLSIYPNPSVSYAGVTMGKFTTKFNSVPEVMNDMAKYGWKYVNSDVIDYKGDSGNNSSSNLINTNEYLQILYFKKTIKK